MENLLPDIPALLEKYFHPLKIILSALLLFGSGLLLARTLEYRKRPKLVYQESAVSETLSTAQSSPKTETPTLTSIVKVDVSGEVKSPGVYSLKKGDRVEDALRQAGGLSAGADRDWVSRNLNLASKLSDGDKIYIPVQGEEASTGGSSFAGSSAGSVAGEASGSSACPAKININTAPAETLQCLYNIGEGRAQAIVDYRSEKPFDSVEEITNIKGVGQKTLERIRERIVVR